MVGSAAIGCDEGDSQWQLGQGHLSVELQQAANFQADQNLPPALCQQTRREDRIDLPDHELCSAEGWIEIHTASTTNGLPLDDLQARLGELLANSLVVRAPYDGFQLALDLVAVTLFDELEIEMTPLGDPDAIDLSRHPNFREGLAEKIPQVCAQLGDPVGLFLEWQAQDSIAPPSHLGTGLISGNSPDLPRTRAESLGPTLLPLSHRV